MAESAAPEQTRSSEREGGQAQAVEVEGLVRRYGERAALDGVTFALPEGMTLGLFGPNGAGKSTLLRVLATLLRPHEGSVSVFGARAAARGLEGARARRATSGTSRCSTAS